MTKPLISQLLAGAVLAAFAAQGIAAEWQPTKPIRMLVGFAPGGGTDATARAMGGKLAERLGQQIIIDNRPGAAGNIATEITSNATPDGYTILMGTIAALAINPSLYKKLPFDPLKSVTPITRAVDSTNALVVHPSVPAKNVMELVALAKSKPLNGGSSGVGGAGHLALELFNLQAGTKIVHIAYKGGGPAMADLLGGQINLIFATAASAVGHIKAGKIRALAVSTAKRSGLLPELPTVSEAGLKGFEANNWYGLLAPAKTPPAVIARLNKEAIAVLNMPDVKDLLFKQGLDVAPSTPEAFGAYIKSEKAQWEKVIKAAGLYHTN
ncbi:MAG: tripartite tricarboxylate transporter substrate binding protein [Burkholderiales bacterium]|jgi:tripartite-type tricarboxylate transporter receptor subunit TctC|nr:tripartite tricarboxylate transporter substrate binding protein [Burkholderiales bacterium]